MYCWFICCCYDNIMVGLFVCLCVCCLFVVYNLKNNNKKTSIVGLFVCLFVCCYYDDNNHNDKQS